MLEKLLDILGFKSYVHIPGKNFNNLTNEDLALMIDADLQGGNQYFEDNALSEFLLMKYPDPRLEKFRKAVLNLEIDGLDEYGNWTINAKSKLQEIQKNLSEETG